MPFAYVSVLECISCFDRRVAWSLLHFSRSAPVGNRKPAGNRSGVKVTLGSKTISLSNQGPAFGGCGTGVHRHARLRATLPPSGTYNCVRVEVAGKTQPCSAPSIELNSDGSYQILAERGTYEIVGGHWLVLSATKSHNKARLDGSKEIDFEFMSHGKKSRIIYRRKYQRPPGWVSG